jgi:catechol 2,3-dioxygenase-like lactoylglutathione lyase family enzyme
MIGPPSHLPAYLPTCLPAHLPTCLLAYVERLKLVHICGVKNAAVLALVGTLVAASQEPRFRFHHLHLASGLDFYARLFAPEITRRTTVANFDALQAGATLLLFGRPQATRGADERPSAIWHVGWGEASLGETYLRHAAREVEWDPPLEADKLHVHLQSPSPSRTAAWYRDVFAADVDVLAGNFEDRPVPDRPELRIAEAVVRFGVFAMLIHRTNEALVSTTGQRIDHLALECDELETTLRDLRNKGVTILEPATGFGTVLHALIEGPDRIAIELVARPPKQ